MAQRFCDSSTLERLIDPLLADLRHEYADAVRQGLRWRSRWIHLAGCIAFWKVSAIALGHASTRVRTLGDGDALGRTIRFAGLATAAMAGLLVWVSLRQIRFPIAGSIGILGVYLLPQALAVALPMGLVGGVLGGLRGRVFSRRSGLWLVWLFLAASVAALWIDGWLLPAGNQAFRQLTFYLMSGEHGVLRRGLNELTVVELASTDRFQFHFRLALACAPLVLGVFSLTIATARRGRYGAPTIVAVAAASWFAYNTLLDTARASATGGYLPVTAAWMPNLAFVALTLLLQLRTRGRSGADPSRRDDGPRSEVQPAAPPA
jgi:hypothetical protein